MKKIIVTLFVMSIITICTWARSYRLTNQNHSATTRVIRTSEKTAADSTNRNNVQVFKARVRVVGNPIPEEYKGRKIFDIVEQMPEFPGGRDSLMSYLSRNVHYPAIAEEKGIQGRVVVSMIVGFDGSISNVFAIVPVDPVLDKEAVRVISSMPKWIPGKQNGKCVNVRYNLPITFRLSEETQQEK